VISLLSCLGDWPGEALTHHGHVPCPDGEVHLEVEVDGAQQQFYLNGQPIGPCLDASIISDEGGRGEHASFTGAFVGVFAQDLSGMGWQADVIRFDYANKI
jgi:xylan 1,4-beta-xylosidase